MGNQDLIFIKHPNVLWEWAIAEPIEFFGAETVENFIGGTY